MLHQRKQFLSPDLDCLDHQQVSEALCVPIPRPISLLQQKHRFRHSPFITHPQVSALVNSLGREYVPTTPPPPCFCVLCRPCCT
jgi:hypothetical protein